MIRGCIFDLDGTLLDSNGAWERAGEIYLNRFGVKADEDLGRVMFTFTIQDTADYFRQQYGLKLAPQEIMDGINEIMMAYYSGEVKPKPGAVQVVRDLYACGMPLAVATATDTPLVEAALRRCGIADCFRGIVSTTDVGVGKTQPDVFLTAARLIGTEPSETIVFEDALHALQTARAAGFVTAAMADRVTGTTEDTLRAASDIYLKSFSDFRSETALL